MIAKRNPTLLKALESDDELQQKKAMVKLENLAAHCAKAAKVVPLENEFIATAIKLSY